ncbi:MAG: beta-xylosidase, partial [Acidobacteriota bacterium]|nr:beta-xylosidase [Acidobacteriota bacterium]
MPVILLLVMLLVALSAACQAQDVQVSVHAAQKTGPYRPVWNYFGADEPNYTYAPNGEKLLRELATLQSSPNPTPTYFRTHNLLTTGDGTAALKWGSTNAYREDAAGHPVYDWTITDKIFDAFHRAKITPLVEVGFMPEAFSTHPQPYRHNFPDGPVFTGWSYPPKDYEKWSKLVTAWAAHLRDRYGNAEVAGWLWEVWNEPDIDYWHGSPEEYDKLYDVTEHAIRLALPHAKIGGPESTGPYGGRSSEFLRQFLDHCAHGKNAATEQTGTELDFISFHPKGSPKVVDGHVQMGIKNQVAAVDAGMKIVASFPEYKDTPIIMGESDPEGCAACSSARHPSNAYRNGPLYGVSIAEATARSYELARREGVNLQGAVTWAFEFENQPYFAGFRDLATNGIDKPVLNVFRMWGMLGGDWVAVTSSGALELNSILESGVSRNPDINAVATRQGSELDVLVWNYHDADVSAD